MFKHDPYPGNTTVAGAAAMPVYKAQDFGRL